GTEVTVTDGSEENAVYPGQTVPVVNVSVGSEDAQVYSGEIEPGSEMVSFGGVEEYGYINDNTSSENYQKGDDVVNVKGVGGDTDKERRIFNKFSKSKAYIDDSEETDDGQLNKYDGGDDIYSVEEISGDAYVFDTGTTYSTFKKSCVYLSPDSNVERYQDEYPIVSSEDEVIDTTESVRKDGSVNTLDDISSEVEHYNDQGGTTRYDASSDGTYGEPIYTSDGDGVVTPGEDVRLTQVSVFSGLDDDNISAINLDQQAKTEILSSDSDLGVKLFRILYCSYS
ncbi:MAG: hypothetical protein ACOCPT_04290, partial [Halanaeroarchaeum sp.]